MEKNITKYIRYTSNGEPLVHPKSYEMINYAVDHSDTKTTLTTNGTLLNEKENVKAFKFWLTYDRHKHRCNYSRDIFKKLG